MPVLGRLSDTLARDSVLGISMFCCAIGFSVLLVATTTLALVVSVLGLSLGISWTGVLNARYMDLFDHEEQGTGFGLVRTVVGVVSSSGSVVTGLLIDHSGWHSAYGLVIVLLIATVCLIVVKRALGLDW